MTDGMALFDVIDGTWPAASVSRRGPWTLREGQGGGSRVSAASAHDLVGPDDPALAATAMREMGQKPLFMIRPGDEALDALLESQGYAIVDPVVIYTCPVNRLTDLKMPHVTAFAIWEPLQIMREIWAAGGIGPERQAVMERVTGPKTGLFGRSEDKPGGVGFAAVHDGTVMVHAIEVPPHQRRKAGGSWIMRAAAFWAAKQGVETMSVVCRRDNIGANALYSSLGMDAVEQYHYRHIPSEKDTK